MYNTLFWAYIFQPTSVKTIYRRDITTFGASSVWVKYFSASLSTSLHELRLMVLAVSTASPSSESTLLEPFSSISPGSGTSSVSSYDSFQFPSHIPQHVWIPGSFNEVQPKLWNIPSILNNHFVGVAFKVCIDQNDIQKGINLCAKFPFATVSSASF